MARAGEVLFKRRKRLSTAANSAAAAASANNSSSNSIKVASTPGTPSADNPTGTVRNGSDAGQFSYEECVVILWMKSVSLYYRLVFTTCVVTVEFTRVSTAESKSWSSKLCCKACCA
jgi:hypothetical protein